MIYDGVSRVLLLGENGAGKRSFVASLLNQFVFCGGVAIQDILISLINIDKLHKHSDRASYILSNKDKLHGMTLANTFAGIHDYFNDELEFEVYTNNGESGFVRFCNINGRIEHSYELLGEDSVQTVVIFISAEDILSGNGKVSAARLFKQLRMLSERQPEHLPMNILFAISKADLICGYDLQNDSFFQKNCQFCFEMVNYCMNKNYSTRFVAFSVVKNMYCEEDVLEETPVYTPTSATVVGLYCIDSALTSYRDQLHSQYNDSLWLIKRNRGIFHNDSVKAHMIADYNRKALASVLKNIYDVDTFSESHEMIDKYLQTKMFCINGGRL